MRRKYPTTARKPNNAIKRAFRPSSLNKAFTSAFKPIAAIAIAQRMSKVGLKIGAKIFEISGENENSKPAPKNPHKNQGMYGFFFTKEENKGMKINKSKYLTAFKERASFIKS